MRHLIPSLAILVSLTPHPLLAGDTICAGPLTGSHENVVVPDGANCTLSDARVDGNVVVKSDAALTVNGPAYIGGNVQSDKSRFVMLAGAGVTVGGNVQTKKAAETSGMMPGTSVLGNFQYVENDGALLASGSFIRGDFQLFKNLGGASIVNNTIRQNMQCKENSPAPSGSGNAAGKKEDQCSGL